MKKYSLIVILFLSSCASSHDKKIQESTFLVDLVESTRIIRALISHNKLSEVLQEHDEEQLELLLDNFSPAQFAFESEVRSCTVSTIVVYYFKDSLPEREFINQLKSLAQEYDNRVKFVIVDVDKLFTLAQDAEIEKIPTLFLIKDQNIVTKFTDPISIESVQCSIQKLLA